MSKELIMDIRSEMLSVYSKLYREALKCSEKKMNTMSFERVTVAMVMRCVL